MRRPFRFRHLAAVAAVFAALAIGGARARADEAPDDGCSSPGQPCMTAGRNHDKLGMCIAKTCTVEVPTSSGGTKTNTFDCHHCVASGAKSSACAVAPERGDAGSLALTVSLVGGLTLLAARRRKAGE